jgi:hypothetical protein
MATMKKLSFIFLPLMLAGFVLPDNSCHSPESSNTIDGPYVLYGMNRIYLASIIDSNGTKQPKIDSLQLSEKKSVSFTVNTDIPGKTFTVKLKDEIENEMAEYDQPSHLLAVSDIEGNFDAFRKLLQAGGAIDSNFNWTFGNGHLVLIGDFFDRGMQVTETLWLIYSLENQAKAAGGHVHFILGNHEIMNLSGDLRYVQPKYIESAGLLKTGYTTLYGENSELGKWLRTKNVVEKIGNILFMHGGISPAINSLDISVNKINKLARPNYADSSNHFDNAMTQTIMGDAGPFWYRGYYLDAATQQMNTIDSTLDEFKVKHIATGHTIIADTVSVLYKGKLFNTDVHHAKGKSEALYFEDGKFYRLKTSGEKILLNIKE